MPHQAPRDDPQRNYSTGDIAHVRFTLTNRLAPGVYYLNCGVKVNSGNDVEFLSRRIDTAIVRVTESAASTGLVGLVDMEASLAVTVTVEA